MIPALPFGPLARRLRHRQEVLRDAARGRALRADPALPWVPDEELLRRVRRLLRAGGQEGPPPGLAALLQDAERLVPVLALTGAGRDEERLQQAADQGAELLAVPTEGALGGSPARFVAARKLWEGRLLRVDYPLSEFDLATAAALGAHAVTASIPLLTVPLAVFLAAARCYALEVVVELRTEQDLDQALSTGGVAGLLVPQAAPEDTERPERIAARVPGSVPLIHPGPLDGLRTAHRLRRSGADAVLTPVGVLDGLGEDEAEEEDEGPAMSSADLQALGESVRAGGDATGLSVLLTSLQSFTSAGSSGLLIPVAAPPPEPEPPAPSEDPPEEDPRPLARLAVRRPRGFRPG